MFNEHMFHLKQVFDKIQKVGMIIKLDKCDFAREELKYLGYNIPPPQGIKADSPKFEAIRNMPLSKNCKQIASFLVLAGWYQKIHTSLCNNL